MEIVPGSVFGIVLPNGINMAKCFLALANYVKAAPLNPNYTEEEFIFYLEDLECKYVVTDESASNNLKNVRKSDQKQYLKRNPQNMLKLCYIWYPRTCKKRVFE